MKSKKYKQEDSELQRKTISQIFKQALENSDSRIKREDLIEEADKILDREPTNEDVYKACLNASKSYIASDPAMREVAADIYLQRSERVKDKMHFELYVNECSHAGPTSGEV